MCWVKMPTAYLPVLKETTMMMEIILNKWLYLPPANGAGKMMLTPLFLPLL